MIAARMFAVIGRPADRRLSRIAPLLILAGAISGCGDDGAGSVPPVAAYGLSGTVSHLDTGSMSISNGSESITVAQGASTFAFTKPLADNSAYTVSVTAQPAGESCVVANASGTIKGAAVSNVSIVCNTVIAQPLALGVSPSGSTNANAGAARIFLPVTQIGGNATTINAILDTGSAGTSLNALDIFPAAMVTTNGFVFAAGQTSITYNGITVTNVVATRRYGGGSVETMQTGNLGFAQITFGRGTTATTAMTPILFIFKSAVNGVVERPSNFANLIGVNPVLAVINVAGTTASSPLQPCTPQSTASCGLASPFRYLSYADGVDKGFVLGKATFAECAIASGTCPVAPILTIGVTASAMTGFNTTGLANCVPVMLIGTGSEPACSQVIPSVRVSSGDATFTGPMIFDSGEPTTNFLVPAGMTFPQSLPMGSTVQIATPNGLNYQYVTGSGYLTTNVASAADAGSFSNSGVGYFARNALLVDYAKAIEGFRSGS